MPEHRRRGGPAGGPLTPGAGDGRRPQAAALAVAIAASSALILSAPAIGTARSALRSAFPGTFSRLIEGGLALAVLAALAAALLRIRTRRALRYGMLAAALAIAWAYSAATGSPDPAIRAVERVHFVEFGVIACLFLRVWRHQSGSAAIVAPFLAAFIAGVGDEAFQWFLPARVGEIADVALNAVAIGCGLLAGAAIAPPAGLRGRWSGESIRLVGRLLAIATVAVAAFVHLVHLGHRLEAPGIGTFASRYRAATLGALDRARAEAWRETPPLLRPPRFSREDQFMTEGLQHVQARNTAWDRGDAFTAWRENRILEQFFPAVLDTPSYVARTGHRWPPAHRADAARRSAGSEGRSFSSQAFPYPILTWPPIAVWLGALGAAFASWAAGDRLAARAARD